MSRTKTHLDKKLPAGSSQKPKPSAAGRERAHGHTRKVSRAQQRAESLRLRRGLGNLGMTLLIPGSVQLTQGNRKLGVTAMRVWMGCLAFLMAALMLTLVSQSAAISLITFKPLAWLLAAAIAVLGLGWGGLMMDSWRLSNPPELARNHRLGFGLLSLALAFCLSGGGIASASVVNTQADVLSAIFSGGGETDLKDGRYNILLLGGDAGTGREGLRPDSMTVASVDAKTGHTVLFSLPRNLEDVEFPADSPMKKLYPDKFTCPNHECLLNAVYTAAMENKELYPGVKDPGAQATKEAIEWTTGLDINYYALIDLNGFKSLIDAVGGISVDVNRRVPVGGGSTEVHRYIEPGKAVHMNGQDALWFARSRHDSSDYERMERQKCVMHAMLNQLEPAVVATKFNEIAGAGKEIVETDVPANQLSVLMTLAAQAKTQQIVSVSFVPPLIYPGEPNFAVIRQTVRQHINGEPAPTSAAAPAAAPTPSGRASSTGHSRAATRSASPSARASASKLPVGNAPKGGHGTSPAPQQQTAEVLNSVCAAA